MPYEENALVVLPEEDDALITADRLPLHIPIARQTLARWRCQGVGPKHTKIGRKVAYRVSEVKAWLSAQTRSNTV